MLEVMFEPGTDRLSAEYIAEVRARAAKLVTEGNAPVDNIFSEKQMRLLTEPLYTSWKGLADTTEPPRKFLALANVGLFYALNQAPVVPDVMLSLDVKPAEKWEKSQKSYFMWEFGKAPEVVIEIVSNREGKEDTSKLDSYSQIGVAYYVIFDPLLYLKAGALRVYELNGKHYLPRGNAFFDELGLGLALWEGEYSGCHSIWLRWTDKDGKLVPSSEEQAARAEQEAARADREAEKTAKLAAKLRELGNDPDTV